MDKIQEGEPGQEGREQKIELAKGIIKDSTERQLRLAIIKTDREHPFNFDWPGHFANLQIQLVVSYGLLHDDPAMLEQKYLSDTKTVLNMGTPFTDVLWRNRAVLRYALNPRETPPVTWEWNEAALREALEDLFKYFEYIEPPPAE